MFKVSFSTDCQGLTSFYLDGMNACLAQRVIKGYVKALLSFHAIGVPFMPLAYHGLHGSRLCQRCHGIAAEKKLIRLTKSYYTSKIFNIIKRKTLTK